MKTIFGIMIFILFMSSLCIAQTDSGVGVKAGICFSEWYDDGAGEFKDNYTYFMNQSGFTNYSIEQEYRFGFAFGLFLNYPINEFFSINPELIYIMKGVKFDGGGNLEGYNVDTQITIKTDYLEIPLLAKLSTSGEFTTKSFLVFGPAISFNTSSELEIAVEIQGESDSDVSDFEDIKGVDYSLIIGGGFITSTGIILEARYNLGLSSVNDASDEIVIKNRTISLLLGFHM